MSKRNKKVKTFQPRPKPPTVEQIHEDIKNASDDDATFLLSKDGLGISNKTSDVMTDSYDDSIEDDNSTASPKEQSDVDVLYNEAIEFIEVHKKLKQAPEKLREQYKYLEKIRQELDESISDLKNQAINSDEKKT